VSKDQIRQLLHQNINAIQAFSASASVNAEAGEQFQALAKSGQLPAEFQKFGEVLFEFHGGQGEAAQKAIAALQQIEKALWTVSEEFWPFIPAALDDCGLSPAQLAVYCHINRRAGKDGECNESIPNMASFLDMHPQTVRPALQVLCEHKLISKKDRAGETTVYRLLPPSEWIPLRKFLPIRKNHRGEKSRAVHSEKSGVVPSENFTGHPYEKTVDKGNPLKVTHEGNPMKGRPQMFPREILEKIKRRKEELEAARRQLDFARDPQKANVIRGDIERLKTEISRLETEERGFELSSQIKPSQPIGRTANAQQRNSQISGADRIRDEIARDAAKAGPHGETPDFLNE
jgi:hypothetical protein